MSLQIKKVIIPAAGIGTRFLPESKAVSKEFLPLVDEPMVSYVVREAVGSNIEQIVFVVPENKKEILQYFKPNLKLENILKKRNSKELLEKLKKIEKDVEGISLTCAFQKIPKGDGDAVLRAKKQIGKSAFGVMFCDDIFDSKIPVLLQMKKIFSTSQKTVLGLKKVPEEKLSSYGIAKVEKIANRLYKIKGFVEKPEAKDAPSDLAGCGRYVFTPEVFPYLEKMKPNKKGEIILAQAIKQMIEDGKIVYGYELEGDWLECGKTIDWLKSNLYLCLKHPVYGKTLADWLKKSK